MILKPGQICPYSDSCKYNKRVDSFCQGGNPDRNNSFECNFVNDKGEDIKEGYIRVIHDVTGKMELIQE